jgi:flagellar hook-associated protein 3 FlgL
MLTNINQNQEDSNRLSLQIATGERMTAPKDDPLAWSRAMDLKQGLRELGSFQKNTDFAVGWNEATYSALTQLDDMVGQAKQVGISAQSAQSNDEKAAQISTLEQLIEETLSTANSQYDNNYVFSGKSLSTAPFDSTTYGYVGDTEDFKVRVGKNNLETINLHGQSVFLADSTDPDSNILKQMEALMTAIQNGDTTEIQNQTAALEDAQERINGKTSLVGARMSSLETRQSSLEDLELKSETDLSDIQDADIVEAATMLTQKQILLEAAFQATSMVSNLNLMDYL